MMPRMAGSPHALDPTTQRLGVHLVLPQHHPLALANTLASLDSLSGGRVVTAAGVSWSEAEFEALGQSFHDRGPRTDEIIRLLRACWRDDPVTFDGRCTSMELLRTLPDR
jgi:alkanesulfonate monooxygenase SsuD/methylene tetrahydromethanopterin reductase-like flavin-dependent oxidoreductase (luciferase family)